MAVQSRGVWSSGLSSAFKSSFRVVGLGLWFGVESLQRWSLQLPGCIENKLLNTTLRFREFRGAGFMAVGVLTVLLVMVTLPADHISPL